jgi:hypothetical protein
MMVEIEHTSLGTLRILRNPIKMDISPPALRKTPLRVAEDNDDIDPCVLGLSQADIDAPRDSGAL